MSSGLKIFFCQKYLVVEILGKSCHNKSSLFAISSGLRYYPGVDITGKLRVETVTQSAGLTTCHTGSFCLPQHSQHPQHSRHSRHSQRPQHPQQSQHSRHSIQFLHSRHSQHFRLSQHYNCR